MGASQSSAHRTPPRPADLCQFYPKLAESPLVHCNLLDNIILVFSILPQIGPVTSVDPICPLSTFANVIFGAKLFSYCGKNYLKKHNKKRVGVATAKL